MTRSLLHPLYRFAYLVRRLDWKLRRPVTTGVCTLLVQDERVLLVWHTYRPGWFFPGGALKRGETLDRAACREVAEEAGVTVAHLELLGVYTAFDEAATNHIAVFVSEDFTRIPREDVEIARCEFFPLDALPPESSFGIERRVADYLQFRRDRRARFGDW